jgi:hypothetical protein
MVETIGGMTRSEELSYAFDITMVEFNDSTNPFLRTFNSEIMERLTDVSKIGVDVPIPCQFYMGGDTQKRIEYFQFQCDGWPALNNIILAAENYWEGGVSVENASENTYKTVPIFKYFPLFGDKKVFEYVRHFLVLRFHPY